jgi:hypothetical protein
VPAISVRIFDTSVVTGSTARGGLPTQPTSCLCCNTRRKRSDHIAPNRRRLGGEARGTHHRSGTCRSVREPPPNGRRARKLRVRTATAPRNAMRVSVAARSKAKQTKTWGDTALMTGRDNRLVQLGGLEPPTSCSTDRRSNQLSYNCILCRPKKGLRTRRKLGATSVFGKAGRTSTSAPQSVSSPAHAGTHTPCRCNVRQRLWQISF